VVRSGHPGSMIVDYADKWGADLIVVGSHGRRGLKRVLIGTVAEAVAMHSHCSVEVIREEPGLTKGAGQQRKQALPNGDQDSEETGQFCAEAIRRSCDLRVCSIENSLNAKQMGIGTRIAWSVRSFVPSTIFLFSDSKRGPNHES
jgi:hypothetical protein